MHIRLPSLKDRHRLGLIAIATATLLLSATNGWAQSPQPTQPDAQEAGQQNQPSPTPDKRGTDEAPITVKILPAPDTQEAAEQDRREKEQQAQSDRDLVEYTRQLTEATKDLANYTLGLVVVTALLAIFTYLLFRTAVKQGRDTKASLEVAQQSAEAANKSADSFIRKERAYIAVHAIDSDLGDLATYTPEKLDGLNPRVRFSYTNIGQTAARIHKVRLGIVIARELPQKPEWTKAEVSYGHIVLIPQTTQKSASRTLGRPITSGESHGLLEPDRKKRLTLFIVGAVVFSDVFDSTRTYVFALKWKKGNFIPTAGDAYNKHHDGTYPEDYDDEE